jgi:hypothetical protein
MVARIPGAPIPQAGATRNMAKRARFEAIARERQIPGVRVLPATEELRRVLRHPNGMAFRSQGSVEWPRDKFTERRLADGSITIEEPTPEPMPTPEPESAPKSEPEPAPKPEQKPTSDQRS